ncbi:MAG: LamG-like jellyroll fold domain-containing protein [Bacteroidota bacterium]
MGCSTCNVTNSNNPLIIGSRNEAIPYNWNGKLDDIGIWNRALTQQEITNE